MFEAGFRLSGEHSYHYYNKISGVNYIDDMIDFALQNERTSEFKEFLTFENRPLSTILNIFGLDGKIGTILKPDVPEVDVIQEYYVKEGETVANSTDVFKKIAMMTIFAQDREQMAHSIRRVNDGLAINSEDGSDMIYERYYE
jgi:biotin carboxylase